MEWSAFEPHIRHLPEQDHRLVRKAFDLAKQLHDGQFRKSGEPYFTHPVAVAIKLAEAGAGSETLIATLLHDTVEDTPYTLEDVEKDFGKAVTMLINGVTKISAADISSPNHTEQAETIRKIFSLMQQDPRIMVIKLYDRLHNMETVKFLSPEKQQILAEETLDVFAKISDRLCMQDLRYQLEELCYGVLDAPLLARMRELRNRNEKTGQDVLRKMRDQLPEYQNVTMELERKTWAKLMAQLEVEGSAVSGLTPVTIAFICPDRETCYNVLGALHKPWRRESLSFQDYINSPETNGYQGLHTTIILEDGTRVRCKIRTEEMHRYAHKGITLYCFDAQKREELEERLPWIHHLQTISTDTQHRSDEFLQSLQSDILGESITIYGPDDRALQLPKNATALDAAFYFFGDKALRTKHILINGKESPFYAVLSSSNALDIVLSDEETLQREWLGWVRTSVALSKIRATLAREKEEERLLVGKHIFQQLLTEKNLGFVEELKEQRFRSELDRLGFHSFRDIFISIAEGRLSAEKVYEEVFEKSGRKKKADQHTYTLNFSVARHEIQRIYSVIFEFMNRNLGEITSFRTQVIGNKSTISMALQGPTNAVQQLLYLLRSAGVNAVETAEKKSRHIFLLAVVILLWAANPVVASFLLHNNLTIHTLSTIRLLTFAVFNIGFFFVWLLTHPQYEHIKKIPIDAFFPAATNGILMFATYGALALIPPSVHLVILRFNTFLLPLWNKNLHAPLKKPFQLLMSAILFGTGILIFALLLPSTYRIGLLLSVVAMACYTLYSVLTERVISVHHIGFRYPVLSFWMGVWLGILGIFSFILQPMPLWSVEAAQAAFYTLLFVCIPYTCYTALLKSVKFRYFTDVLLLEVPLAFLLEYAFVGISGSWALYGVAGLVLLAIAALRLRGSRSLFDTLSR